jgi:hypothetical protein
MMKKNLGKNPVSLNKRKPLKGRAVIVKSTTPKRSYTGELVSRFYGWFYG